MLVLTIIVGGLAAGDNCHAADKFRLADGGESVAVFGDYRLEFKVESFEVTHDYNDRYVCYVGVCQEYPLPVSDTVRVDSLRRIEIRRLCAVFDCNVAGYCPGPDSLLTNHLHFWREGTLRGPFYCFGHARINKNCKSVQISFEACLMNRETGEEIAFETIDVHLER